jgi:hypothetical protein
VARRIQAQLGALERQQHGLVSLAQLRELDCTNEAVRYLVESAQLERLRRGILASPAVVESFEQRVLAAVIIGGVGACASHESAAQLWSLPLPGGAMVEITTALERHPILDGVRVHRSSLLLPEDVTEQNCIPVTSSARTIVDLSGRLDLRSLGRMVDDALRRKVVTLDGLHETVERLRPAPGRSVRKMRLLLARRDDGTAHRESVLEDFVHHAVSRFRLPEPVAQFEVIVGGRRRRIDFCYPEPMVALEPKGFDYRRFRQRFDEDALRGNELQLAGYRVLEFTSAFTDWQIACQVARALELAVPRRPRRVLSFRDWAERLETSALP